MKRTAAWIVVAVISVACAAPAPPTSPAPVVNPPAALVPPTGRVLEYGTLAPIGGAVVSFFALNASLAANPSPLASAGTDATGGYRVDLPPNTYRVDVDGVAVAVLTLRPGIPHGDFIVRAGTCSVTYGFVTNASSDAPLEGAVVTLMGRRVTTTSRGWYSIDFGCDLPVGGNTTFIDFAREGYAQKTLIYGRGVRGMRRFDAALTPQ